MERLTRQQLRALLEFVRGLYACHDRDACVSYFLYGISTVIPVEFSAFAEIDDYGKIIDALMKPFGARCNDIRQLYEQHLQQHPLLTYYRHTGDGSAVKLSDFLTTSRLYATKLYTDLYKPLQVRHVMSVVLCGSQPRIAAMALHRSRLDFSERDRLLLNLLRQHLSQAWVNVQAVRSIRQKVDSLERVIEARGEGIVLLTKDGRVQLVSGRAQQWLAHYFDCPSRRTNHLPEVAESWLACQEASIDVADDAPLPRKPFVVEGKGGRLVIRHLCETDHCILLMQEHVEVQAASLQPSGLTRREADVLLWVAHGKTNTDIGAILGLSARTVQKHLEHIFKKLGVETRLAAARALAPGAPRKR